MSRCIKEDLPTPCICSAWVAFRTHCMCLGFSSVAFSVINKTLGTCLFVIFVGTMIAGRKGGIAALGVLCALTIEAFMTSKTDKKQDFLEADPYWDQSTVPVNVHKNKAPFTGKVVSTKRIVGPKATGETCHIVIDHKGEFPYWEGQSWGVIPPSFREKDGKPHSVRLYSIAVGERRPGGRPPAGTSQERHDTSHTRWGRTRQEKGSRYRDHIE